MAEERIPGMPAIVIGASGFIGRNLLARLSQAGAPIYATYRNDAGFVPWAEQFPSVTPVSFEKICESGFADSCECCYYVGGNADHGLALRDPILDLQSNALTLLKWMQRFRGRLVFLSTGAVYYGARGPVSPDSAVAPVFPYAISKLASELYIRAHFEAGTLRSYIIVRFYYAYGLFDRPRRLFPRLCALCSTRNSATFNINGDGSTLLAPMYVEDVTAALTRMMNSPVSNVTVDLCAREPISLRSLVERVAAFFNCRLQLCFVPSEEQPLGFWSRNEPAEQLFGLDPPRTLEAGLQTYAEWR